MLTEQVGALQRGFAETKTAQTAATSAQTGRAAGLKDYVGWIVGGVAAVGGVVAIVIALSRG